MFDDNQEFDFDAQAPAWEDCLNDPFDNLPDFSPGSPIPDDTLKAVAAFHPRYADQTFVKAATDMNRYEKSHTIY